MDNNLKNETLDFGRKYINDPLYGGIALSTLEMEIISTSIFQRLRNLKQLAHVNYVFPTAEHSRFAHSLGVMYIMGRMADKLVKDGKIEELDVVYLRVAALLHDIGHYPLSHLGEAVFNFHSDHKRAESFIDIDNDEKNEFTLSQISSYSSKAKPAHHEKLGKYIIENNKELNCIFDKYGLDARIIAATITGKIWPKNPVYSQLMHSSLDADRLDYLLRDSFQTGVRYGLVDYEYLIRLLDIHIDYQIWDSQKNIVVWNKKGQHVLEHFLMSRYFLYSQVVGHKTSLAFESILKLMFLKLIQKQRLKMNSYDEILEKIDSMDFIHFNDNMLYHSLHEYSKGDDKEFNLLYKCFINRIRPKTVYEIKALYEGEEPNKLNVLTRELIRNPSKIQELIGASDFNWGYYIFPIEIEKIPRLDSINTVFVEKDDEALIEAIKMRDANGEVSFLASDELSIINKLYNYKTKILRIFVVDESGSFDVEGIKSAIDSYIAS
ncbi:MAG: HD domain-containing protein [Gudongella sp.]|jgi:HD superfamily phosphohydrolase|nr:HD domain-containing protein [Gudongella sp.]